MVLPQISAWRSCYPFLLYFYGMDNILVLLLCSEGESGRGLGTKRRRAVSFNAFSTFSGLAHLPFDVASHFSLNFPFFFAAAAAAVTPPESTQFNQIHLLYMTNDAINP